MSVRHMWLCYNVTSLFLLSVDGRVYGLAVNPEDDQLYISDFNGKKIHVTSLDGNGGRTLVNCTGAPQGLAVDLNRR